MVLISKKEAISQGLKRYFTGIPCRKNHVSERTIHGSCIECNRLNKRELYIKNPKKVSLRNKIWKQNNPEKVLELKKKFYYDNIEKEREKRLEYYHSNNEKCRLREAAYRKANNEKVRKRLNQYKKENKGKVLADTRKRQCAKLQRTPKWANLNAIEKVYIDCSRISKETGIVHHVDHIVPLQGKLVSGLHVEYNLQILTATENMSKGNRI